MRNTIVIAAVSLGLGLAQPALAGKGHSHGHSDKSEAGHTQLGAHEHGSGKLNIAITGKTVAIELEIPAADIVGFEHAAETKEQKAQLETAKAQLAAPLDLFVISTGAGCTVTTAKIETEGALAGDDHGHSHGHSHGKGEKHAEDAHSEFHAEYELTCATPSEINAIEFAFFKAFPNSKELDVSVVGDRGTTKFEATRASTTMTFPASS